jgi:hypothetical protein
VNTIGIQDKDENDAWGLCVLPRDEDNVNLLVNIVLIHPRLLLAHIVAMIWVHQEFTICNVTIWHTLKDEEGQ